MVKMGRWCCGHHERLREVGKERGWNVMKKQNLQDAIQSTCVLGNGGKNLKWWEVVAAQREVLMMHDGWRRVERSGREVFEPIAKVGR
jgi:hypothetical protein